MKTADVETGAVYTAKVSGRIVELKLLTAHERTERVFSRTRTGEHFRTKRIWRAENLSTGRIIEVTASRLRSRVLTESEQEAQRAQFEADKPWINASLVGAARGLWDARLNPAKRGARIATTVAP